MASAARPSSERLEQQRKRRKIPLACEPCRERKSRCDGAKPICSTCQRRSLPMHHCVYTLENARTASSEAYIKVLHDRIRRLEKTCTDHGIPIPPLDSGDGSEGEISGPGLSPLSPVIPGPIPGSGPGSGPPRPTNPNLTIPSPPVQTHHHTSSSPNTALRPPPIPVVASPERERFDVTESTASVTGMGTVTAEHDVPQTFDAANEFYGSSSAASFMKEAYTSVKPHRPRNASTATTGTSTAGAAGHGTLSNGRQPFLAPFARSEPHTFTQFAQVDKFALPPRNLADHLLSRFWERVYWLYPLFDKPTFLHAYETLWRPAHEQPKPPDPHQQQHSKQHASNTPLPGLGLGSTPGADAHTIVFHCALNTIFALGSQFSDLSLPDKAAAIETFFDRAKAFVGLDFIDMHNVGVVQSLLLMALLLQSTPFPNRCWNAVGLACRVAQGLGLHTEGDFSKGERGGGGSTESGEGEGRPGLEMEVRRRTWHGCVILDMIVSMTYGRPTMTAHLPDIPFPSTIAEPGRPDSSSPRGGPSEMCFYIEYIRQCRILGEILSHVYQPSAGGQPPQTQPSHQGQHQHPQGHGVGQGQQSWFDQKSHGMDAILGLDAKLSRYETELPTIMSWKAPCDISGLDAERKLIIVTQRTVLRGSFLYLRLMLHRPILTQLCANTEASANSSPTNQTSASTGSGAEAPNSPMMLRPTGSAAVSAGRELFTSFAAGCAKICLGAAVDLIELVHSTYLTNSSGGWWWDGLYAFTAGLAVIVGYLSPSLLASMDKQRLERSWMRCQEILAHFTSFSVSAQRSLRLLQKVHGDVMSRCSDQELPLGLPAMSAGVGPGEAAMAGQQAGGFMNPEDMPLDLGSGFQWQMAGSDMMGAGLVFNWDQSLDMISGGLGMDLYQ